MVIGQNNLFIGLKAAPIFTKATISGSKNGFTTPVVPGFSVGVPIAYRINEKYTLTLSLNFTVKFVSIKNNEPLDTSGFSRSTGSFNTKEIQLYYSYLFKHYPKYNYYVGAGASLDFATLWKKGKAPGESTDTLGIQVNGNDLETRAYVSLIGALGLEKQLRKGRKINIELNYIQGLQTIQTFYITRYGQNNKTSYFTKGSYIGLSFHFYPIDVLNYKKDN